MGSSFSRQDNTYKSDNNSIPNVFSTILGAPCENNIVSATLTLDLENPNHNAPIAEETTTKSNPIINALIDETSDDEKLDLDLDDTEKQTISAANTATSASNMTEIGKINPSQLSATSVTEKPAKYSLAVSDDKTSSAFMSEINKLKTLSATSATSQHGGCGCNAASPKLSSVNKPIDGGCGCNAVSPKLSSVGKPLDGGCLSTISLSALKSSNLFGGSGDSTSAVTDALKLSEIRTGSSGVVPLYNPSVTSEYYHNMQKDNRYA